MYYYRYIEFLDANSKPKFLIYRLKHPLSSQSKKKESKKFFFFTFDTRYTLTELRNTIMTLLYYGLKLPTCR